MAFLSCLQSGVRLQRDKVLRSPWKTPSHCPFSHEAHTLSSKAKTIPYHDLGCCQGCSLPESPWGMDVIVRSCSQMVLNNLRLQTLGTPGSHVHHQQKSFLFWTSRAFSLFSYFDWSLHWSYHFMCSFCALSSVSHVLLIVNGSLDLLHPLTLKLCDH